MEEASGLSALYDVNRLEKNRLDVQRVGRVDSPTQLEAFSGSLQFNSNNTSVKLVIGIQLPAQKVVATHKIYQTKSSHNLWVGVLGG